MTFFMLLFIFVPELVSKFGIFLCLCDTDDPNLSKKKKVKKIKRTIMVTNKDGIHLVC